METQNELKTTVSFLDADRNNVEVEIEITFLNGYKEFSMTGDYGNGGGQIQDHIKPANEPQERLLKMWKEYHLKNVESIEDINQQIETLVSDIEEAEEERKGDPLSKLTDEQLIELIKAETEFSEDRDIELCAALVRMFDLPENDLQDIEIDGNRSTVQGTEYLAGTDEEMDEEWDQDLENYIDECILHELPEQYRDFFDNEGWKDYAKQDGRTHSLNRYDRSEKSCEINGTKYFAYRQ